MEFSYKTLLISLGILLLVLLVVFLIYWYNGWKYIAYSTGNNVSFPVPSGDTLKFRDASYTITTAAGVVTVADVKNKLETMYVSSGRKTPFILNSPLSAFSFVITGVNDSGTVPDPTVPNWANATATLNIHYKTS